MQDIHMKMSAMWVTPILTYLLGDVLRIFSGDFQAGEIGGMKLTQGMRLMVAGLMLFPILMAILSQELPQSLNHGINIVVAIFFFYLQYHRFAYLSICI